MNVGPVCEVFSSFGYESTYHLELHRSDLVGQLLGDRSWRLVVDENRECPSWHVTPKRVANQSGRNCFRSSMK